jgi:glycosyltransferase involved in cell wall biosynthesis
MKIAIVAPSHKSFIAELLPNYSFDSLPNGYAGATFVGTIIKELLERGHEVIAVTTSVCVGDIYEIKVFRHNNFSWHVVPERPHSIKFNGKKPGRIVDLFAFEIRLMSNILIDLKPDLIHSFWSYEFTAAAKKSKLPFLATIEDNAFVILKYLKNFYRFGRLIMSELILKDIRFLSTVSPYMVNYCKRKGAFVKVIPNPTPIINDISAIQLFIQNRISLFPKFKIVMINNGWEARKNGKCGLLAFQQLLIMYPDATLHLFGSGSEEGGAAATDTYSLHLKNVYFHGMVPKDIIFLHLKEAHIFLHPALEESFGVVLIEAMALGVPAIGGEKSGGVPWVVNDPDLLVDVTNAKKIGEKLISLLSNKELYMEKSISAYTKAVNKYSSKIIVDNFIEYYEEVLKLW